MRLKDHFIKMVVDELDHLNGSEFESMCRPLLEIITGREFELKGHNLEMKPVKGTVDLIQDDDYRVIGQCGTDKDYFSGDKPIKDIEGSIKNSPGFKTIYLFCNRKANGDDYQNVKKEIEKKLKTLLQTGYHYHLYDGQRIAEKIYDNIYQKAKIEEILGYLPGARQYYLSFPQSNNLPALPSFYETRPEEADIAEKLKCVDFLQVYGLSGIGKSLLSLAVANNLFLEFDTILWINGKELDPEKLDSVKINRLGDSINLSFILDTLKVLLIVDNLNDNVSVFQTNFDKVNKTGSKCIVTSLQQNVANENSFALTYVSEEVTRKILLNTSVPPTETQLEELIDHISGYPLLLELAKKAVEGNRITWDEVISETNITEINDTHRNEIFAQRIVGRYVDRMSDMFNLLVWLDSCDVSKDFLREKSLFRLNDLFTYAILQDVSEYQCRLHQVVLSAIKAVLRSFGKDEEVFEYASGFIKRHVTKRDAGLYTFMALHRDKMMSLTEGLSSEDELRHYIVLAVVYTVDTYSSQDVYLQMINDLDLDVEHRLIDLRLFIEKKEIEQSKAKSDFGVNDDRYNEKYRKDVEELKSLNCDSDEAKALILHHIGKWLYNIGDKVESEKNLLEALKMNPKSYHSMAKLAKDYRDQKKQDDVETMVREILKDDNFNEAPISVRLTAYDVMAQKKYQKLQKEFIDGQFDKFTSVIYASLSENYSHTYIVLAKLCNHLSYNHPDFFSNLCSQLPLPLNIENDIRLRESYGRIKLAQFRYGNCDPAQKTKLAGIVEAYLKDVPMKDDYNRKDMMNFYISADQADKAIPIYEEFEDKDSPFALQALSKAYYGSGKYPQALDAIEKAIANEDDNDTDYKAAFRHDKARALHVLGDERAIEIMNEAIGLQSSEKVKKEWEDELKNW